MFEDLKYDPISGLLFRDSKAIGTIGPDGYLRFSYKNKVYLVHRVAWFIYYGYWPLNIDHINRRTTDNSLVNMRDVSRRENNFNSERKTGASGRRGVFWEANLQKWRANITIDYKKINLGVFSELDQAIEARRAGELKYYGKTLEQLDRGLHRIFNY